METWRPHPGQQTEYFRRWEFEALYGGAAGGGKTDCLIFDALRGINKPGYKAVIFRRTYPQLAQILDRTRQWYTRVDPGAEYKVTEHRWIFSTGATVLLAHMQNEADKYNHQGSEYHFVGFDELTQFTPSQYTYLFSRCRSTDPAIRPKVRATTNPGGVGHVFVKDRFKIGLTDPGTTIYDEETGLSRVFIPGKIADNPTLTENDPDYVKRLMLLPEIERMRLLEGIWDVFEGQVFSELNQQVHGCEPFDIPPDWERFMSFDWGYAKPFSCGWWAVDYDGVLHRYREWYGMKDGEPDMGLRLSNTEIAHGIIEREKGEKIKYRTADPACWNRRPGKNRTVGPSPIEDMAKDGLYFLKADNDRILGKNQFHQRLRLHDDGSPQFYVFNTCGNWWRTMLQLRQDDRNPEDVDTSQEDHIYDETRYAFMSRPIAPKLAVKPDVGSFQAERRKLLKAKAYAARHGVSLGQAYGMAR